MAKTAIRAQRSCCMEVTAALSCSAVLDIFVQGREYPHRISRIGGCGDGDAGFHRQAQAGASNERRAASGRVIYRCLMVDSRPSA